MHGKSRACVRKQLFFNSRISKLSYWEVPFLDYLLSTLSNTQHCSFVQSQEITMARLSKQAKNTHLETSSINKQIKLQHPADLAIDSQNS